MPEKKLTVVKTAQKVSPKVTPQKPDSPKVTPEKPDSKKVTPDSKKVTTEKPDSKKVTPPEKIKSQQKSAEKKVTQENSVQEKARVTPLKSSPEKSDDELQVENGIHGSKRHPTVLVCKDKNCIIKKLLMGCGFEAAMRIKRQHISGLKSDPKKQLFPENMTPKKKSPKSEGNGSPRRSPRLQEKDQQALLQIDWSKILVSPDCKITVMVAGKPMKLKVVPEEEKKEESKGDDFVNETSDSDTKSKPEITVGETESEKEEEFSDSKTD